MRAILALVFIWATVEGAAACGTMSDMLDASVVGAPDGATLILSSGDKVRLSGIQAPKLDDRGEASMNWPLAEDAKALLGRLTAGRSIALAAGQAGRDRHGRLLGQAYLADGTWLQGEMVSAGLARAYSFADNRDCATELLAAERRARAERIGIWSNPFYAVRDAARPADLLARAGYFELVEGRVLASAKSGATFYLNFGRHWKEDFTVSIDKAALKLFAASGVDPLAYEGALVRVRGWIENLDGPRIVVTHPEQIEVLATP